MYHTIWTHTHTLSKYCIISDISGISLRVTALNGGLASSNAEYHIITTCIDHTANQTATGKMADYNNIKIETLQKEK